MKQILSQAEWAERAKAVLPAGGFGNFDPSVFIKSGQGSRVWDEDGKEYVVYHAYDKQANGAPTLRIAPVRWGADGWPVADY